MTTAANASPTECPHFDHHDESMRGDDVYPVYERLREQPVQWSDNYGGFWIVSRLAEVREVLSDWETFSSADGCFLPDIGVRTAALDMDPPEHTKWRALFLPVGGRPAAKASEAKIAKLAQRIVSEFTARGGGDAISQLSEILPVEAIALVAGFSEQVAARMRQMTIHALGNLHEDPLGAMAPLGAYMAEQLRARRSGTDDDFVTALANGTLDASLTIEGAADVLRTIVIAGHETTMNASGNLMLELAKHPTLQDQLAEHPDQIPRVVEESLRHRAPTHIFFRTVTREVQVAGTKMRVGDKVGVLYGSANRDERHFENPEAFNPERASVNHVSFGWGIHRCVGAPLAQLELKLLAEQIIRHGRIELDGEPVPQPLEGGLHMGWKSLPLRFTSVG